MNFFRRCCESKRECLTYVIILIWVGIGILGTYYETNFTELAAYFISLTGFAGAYMYGESMRQSNDASIFRPGKSSKREIIIYITVGLWLLIGIFTIINKLIPKTNCATTTTDNIYKMNFWNFAKFFNYL